MHKNNLILSLIEEIHEINAGMQYNAIQKKRWHASKKEDRR
jgi:hypothetical protein